MLSREESRFVRIGAQSRSLYRYARLVRGRRDRDLCRDSSLLSCYISRLELIRASKLELSRAETRRSHFRETYRPDVTRPTRAAVIDTWTMTARHPLRYRSSARSGERRGEEAGARATLSIIAPRVARRACAVAIPIIDSNHADLLSHLSCLSDVRRRKKADSLRSGSVNATDEPADREVWKCRRREVKCEHRRFVYSDTRDSKRLSIYRYYRLLRILRKGSLFRWAVSSQRQHCNFHRREFTPQIFRAMTIDRIKSSS